MVEVAKSKRRKRRSSIFLSFAIERALVLRKSGSSRPVFARVCRPCQAAGSSCQPSRRLPAIAVTIVSSRHTPSSAFLASRRPVQRTNRHSPLSNDTSHTYPPCLPISGESTPQLDLAGGKDGHHGQEKIGEQTEAPIFSNGLLQRTFVLTLLFSSPVYAVSATFQHLSIAAYASQLRRDAIANPSAEYLHCELSRLDLNDATGAGGSMHTGRRNNLLT